MQADIAHQGELNQNFRGSSKLSLLRFLQVLPNIQTVALFSLNAVVCLSQLLLLHYASQSKINIERSCNEDVSLECPIAENNKHFLSVAWYKVSHLLQA